MSATALTPIRRSPPRLAVSWGTAIICLACSAPQTLGTDLLWTAEHESGDFAEWTAGSLGEVSLPNAGSQAKVSTKRAHHGKFSAQLVNASPAEHANEGPELSRVIGTEADAYYSAWFLLPDSYALESNLTLVRLESRASADGKRFHGEELQLRTLPNGDYVVTVFSHNPAFLRAPVADPPPHVSPRQWFQLELRYEPQRSGRLRAWIDGRLAYDLTERPGADGDQIVLRVCNVTELPPTEPIELFIDDVAVSTTRVSPFGQLQY
jgi:hypothetical protein